MDANLDLNDIGRVEMSLQNLIGTNHINCDVQKWLFEEIMKSAKDETQKGNYNIDKCTWPRKGECNIMGMRD